MPSVPSLEAPNVTAEPLPGRPYPRVSDEAPPAAFGAAEGAGLERLSDEVTSVEAQQKLQHDNLRVIDANTQLEAGRDALLYGTPGEDGKQQGGAFSFHGADAINLPAKLLPAYQDMAAKINSTLTPDQQRVFQRHIATGQNELTLQLNRYEFQESNRLTDEIHTNALDQAVSSASLGWRDPIVIGKSRADIKASIDLDTRLTAPQKEIQTRAQLARMDGAVIDSMLTDHNTDAAMAYFKAQRDEITAFNPKVALAMENNIEAKQKEKQNEQKQDIVDRAQDSMAAARFGLPNALTVSRADMRLAYPKDGDRRYDGLLAMQAAGAKATKYDQMTPEDIQADVEHSRPTQGGPEAVFAIEGYEIRARAAEQSIRARQSDPAQFAIGNGMWKPLDLRDPQQFFDGLHDRANTQETVSEHTGVNTPILSKSEQKAVTQWVASQEPAARLQMLSQMRSSVPGDLAYTSLMSQIAPGSPLTAIAGATLDRPSKSEAPPWYDPKFSTPPIVGQRILEGEAILAPKKNEKGEMTLPKYPMPADKDLQPYFAAAIGGTDSDVFRGRDQTQGAYWDAYKAYYAAESSARGQTNGVLSADLARQAAHAVIGPVVPYGHSEVVVPAGMDPSRFEGTVRSATRSALADAGYSKTDISALRAYGLRELGDTLGTGRYGIINGNGDLLRSKDGKDVITIDLSNAPSGPVEAETTMTPGFPTHGR